MKEASQISDFLSWARAYFDLSVFVCVMGMANSIKTRPNQPQRFLTQHKAQSMNASETTFQPIIEGTKQYVVPLFQRPYSWKLQHWQVLWDDLVWLCDNPEPKSHFIGSIVTMPTTSVPEGVPKYLLIDGQQRLTTIFILLTEVVTV